MNKKIIIEVGILRIMVVLLQLIFLKIYTANTSIYELGLYYFLFTASYSINAFLLVPLDYFQQSQVYRLKKQFASLKSFYQINKWVLKFAASLLLISTITCYILKPEFVWIVAMIISIAVSSYFVNLIRGIINNLEKRRVAMYTLLIEGIVKLAFYWIFSKVYTPNSSIILLAIFLASIFILGVLFFVLKGIDEFNYSSKQSFSGKDIIAFSYPISVGAVINWIQLQGYRMILVPLGLIEVVGIYGTVANVGTSGMSAFSTIYSQLFIPNLYKSNGSYIITYLKYAILSALGVLFIGYFLSDFIILMLTKYEFVKYSSLIVYGIISEAGNFLIGGLTIYLTIRNLTKATLKASIVGLVLFITSFGSLYLFSKVDVYTIGLPIVISQIAIATYLTVIVYRSKSAQLE